jgi:hypothetical protein
MGGMFWVAADKCPECHGAGGFRWHEADGSENGEQCLCAGRLPHYPSFTVGHDMSGALPDLGDPATVGCLRALVGEAWGSDHDVSRFATHTERGVEIWYRLERLDLNGWNSLVTVPVMSGETRFIGGATLAEALVDALLHAPVQP